MNVPGLPFPLESSGSPACAAVVAGGIFFILAAMLTQRVEDLYDARQPSGSLTGNAVAAKS